MEIAIIRQDGTERVLHGVQVVLRQVDQGAFVLEITDTEERHGGIYTAACAHLDRIVISE